VTNGYLKHIVSEAVKTTVTRMVRDGELYTPDQMVELLSYNSAMTSKMLTIVVHDVFGIGKKRFKEKAQPALLELEAEHDQWCKDVDADYADGKMNELYERIMDDE